MCIAIHKPPGVVLGEQTYRNCFLSNRDGAGFAFAENGRIVSQKGFFDFDAFYAAVQPHEQQGLIVHFRLATHGATDEANCHPWLITGCAKDYEFAVIHNGILSYPSSKEKSDTGHFVDEILAPLLTRDPWFLDSRAAIYLIEETIGSFNKLVILRSDGKVYILNESAGTNDLGCWFSNDGYEEPKWLGFMRNVHRPDAEDYDIGGYPDYMRDAVKKVVTPTATMLLPYRSVLGEKPPGTLCPHLNKRLRKQLLRLAERSFGNSDLSRDTMVRALRDLFRERYPDRATLPDADLDREILKLSFDGWDDVVTSASSMSCAG